VWKIAWRLIKDTTSICIEYRVTGLAAEVAFYTLMSVPPLLLCVAGTLGYLDDFLGAGTIDDLQHAILNAAGTVLSPSSVNAVVKPLLHSVFSGGRPDLISIGFLLSLWSGSRALYVFVDTVTIMYGLEGRRGIVHTRMLSLGLWVAGLMVGAVVLPLVLAGPGMLVAVLPMAAGLVHALYWPVAVVLSVVFMTTLYHVAVPARTPWREDLPGALVALLVLVVGSALLRIYLVHAVEGPTVYGSLAAPVAVLLWIGVTALAVLIGAAMNACIDRLWPSRETAEARAENARAREAAAAEVIRVARAREAAEAEGGGEGEAPSEYPERWAKFLPPGDVRSRIQGHGGQGE
jgi:membrane protein